MAYIFVFGGMKPGWKCSIESSLLENRDGHLEKF